MVSRKTRYLRAIAASFLILTTAGSAFAGNVPRWGHGYNHGGHWKVNDKKGFRHSGGEFNPGIIVGGGSISVVPGVGTYVGSISAYRVSGNGTYLGSTAGSTTVVNTIAPKAKIILVSEEGDNACSYEAGVCIIRP